MTPYSVFVGGDVVVKEIVLPLDGSLVLDDDVSIAFSNDTVCDNGSRRKGNDMEFVGGQRKDWFNPNYWQTSTRVSSHELDADLPLNRLPCEHDDVVFPDNATVSVYIDREVLVRRFEYHGTPYHDDVLQRWLQSVEGKRQFQFINKPNQEASLTASGQSCTDTVGCPCGNSLDNTDFIQEECRSYVLDSCPDRGQLSCSNPFLPPGACCHICGSAVQVTVPREYQKSFNYYAFLQAVYRVLQSHNTTGVGLSRIQLADGSGSLVYSILFLSGSRSPTPAVTGRALKDVLTGTGDGGLGLPEDAVMVQLDHEEVLPGVVLTPIAQETSTKDSSDNTTIYIALGAVGGIGVILSIVVVVLVIQRKSNKKSLRKLNAAGGMGHNLGVVSFTNVSENAIATVEGFDNPIYTKERANPVYEEASTPTVVNPVFEDEEDD